MRINVDRSFLEINSIKNLNQSKSPGPNFKINQVDPPDFQLNKFFYKQIGKNHRWGDRLAWNEKSWIDYVEDRLVKTYVLREKEDPVGYFEQIFHIEKKSCEIAYFGILKEYYGKKYGGFLLSEAIKNSFINGIDKVLSLIHI